MNRRGFVGAATLAALGPFATQLLSGCAANGAAIAQASGALTTREAQTLFAVSRAMLPHRDATDQPYLDAVAALEKAAGESEDTRELLKSAVEGLDAAAGGDWLAATPERKVAILESQQGAAYFGLVLNTSIDAVYRHPEIWALVGYGGSSLEHGGYLYRGFDDIDWLPGQSAELAQ